MALTFTAGSASIGATEFSIAANANYSAGVTQATQAQLHPWINFSNMVAGDEAHVRLYETVNGVYQLTETWAVYGVVSKQWQIQLGIVGEGWDVTVQFITGGPRTIKWSLRKNDETNANVVSLAGGIATAIAASVWSQVLDNGHSAANLMRGMIRGVFGKLRGVSTLTPVWRDLADTKDIASATVTSDGRTVVTILDFT